MGLYGLVGYCPCDHKELDMTERLSNLSTHTHTHTRVHTHSENSGFQMLLHPYRLKNNLLEQGSREEAWSESKKLKTSYIDCKIIYSTISKTVRDLNTMCKLHARECMPKSECILISNEKCINMFK